jgi:hypothetical protein
MHDIGMELLHITIRTVVGVLLYFIVVYKIIAPIPDTYRNMILKKLYFLIVSVAYMVFLAYLFSELLGLWLKFIDLQP